MINQYNYFKENEIFLEEDKKYIHNESLQILFHNFIHELFSISQTIKKPETKLSDDEYLKKLKILYENYQFPSGFDLKIPLKYANEEYMYLYFIIKLKGIFCIDEQDAKVKRLFKYKITDKFLALNYFQNYFELKKYEINNIQYAIFCLEVFFRYYNLDDFLLIPMINEKFLMCSRFLFQDINEKKEY